MKIIRLFVFAAYIISACPVIAQNVGIGEPNPSEKLDVNGRIVAKGYKNTIYNAGGLSVGSVTLNSTNTWTDFPDLTVTFLIDEATTVMSSYTISMENITGGPSFLVTRIMIDGVEVNRLVIGEGGGDRGYLLANGQYVSELPSGSHTIKIQYRTLDPYVINPAGTDWQNRFLQVLVFGSN